MTAVSKPFDFKSALSKLRGRDDITVRYYLTSVADDVPVTQEERNLITAILDYFSVRTKRDRCPPSATVTAELSADAQGYLTNRTEDNPLVKIFLATKHIGAMISYYKERRPANVILHLNFDKSPFFAVE